MKVSLALIVRNELRGCQEDVPRLPMESFHEVFAVDGGSTDGTAEYIESMGVVVHQQPKRGLNAAYVHANDIATGDAVVAYFPKGTLPVGDVLKFKQFFEDGNDLVVASRQIASSANEEDVKLLRPRKWAVFALASVSALVWRREGYFIRDVLHGFKGWTREAFYQMKVLDYGLSIDIEMVVRSYKLRLNRCEFATREKARNYGDSNFKFWPTGRRLLGYLWFELTRKD